MKRLLTYFMATVLLVAGATDLFAQGKVTVSGTVLDESGLAVIGAGVVEQGTLNGTTTSIDGSYSLTVSSENAVLEISFVGYETQLVTVDKRNRIDVILREDAKLLDEVVVVGYGTVKKKDLTGAVANVDGGKLAAIQSTGLAQSLQGSMPGVQVTRTSGLPGADATIRVRGITTIGDSSPLLIADGVPVSSLAEVDVDNIDNITILKDAASASIYGARAAAGVVLITTKRAKEGQLSIDYNGSYSMNFRTTAPKQVDAVRFMQLQNEAQWNDAGNPEGREYFQYDEDYVLNYMENHKLDPDTYPITNWDALMIEKWAPQYKHRLSVSYGNKVIKSRAMLSYSNEDALYFGRSQEQYMARINNDIKINNFISASFDMTYNHRISNNNQVNPVQAAFKYNPIYVSLWSDGTWGPGNNGTNTYARLHAGGFVKGLHEAFFGKASLIITPFKNFTITGVFAPSIRTSKTKDYIQRAFYYKEPGILSENPLSGCTYNRLLEKRTESMDFTKQLLLNYNVDFGSNHMTFLLGYEDYYAVSESLRAGSDQMELGGYPYLRLANKNFLVLTDGDDAYPYGNASESALSSFFGRFTYDYKGRYLFQANARYDQSSRFAPGHRGGFFPSVSVGWVLSEEPFMKGLTRNGVLSFLKIRGSYGTLGNERIGNYPWQSTLNFGTTPMYVGDEILAATTAAQVSYAIRDITWETTKTWDIGLDFNMFNNRLSFTGDYYYKTTYGMLLSRKIPDVLGYSDPQDNIGDMYTRGWEFQIGWNDRKGDFTYALSFNLSDYTSIMGNLGGYQSLGSNIVKEGIEYNAWYGYHSPGLFLDAETLATAPKLYQTVKLGDLQYADISGPDGEPDGMINAEYDRKVLGSSVPHYQFGGNINLGWKNWDLSMIFQGIGSVLAYKSQAMVYRDGDAYTFPVEYDKWYYSELKTPEQNAKAKYPRATLTNTAKNNYEQMTDFWLFNGRYFRMKNITLSYTVPSRLTKKIQVQRLRIYASATDPFSISAFPQGWDPESYSNLSAYMVKTFTGGVQITF